MIKDISTRCWILALIVRDDGERLLLGDGAYEFKERQQHFSANSYVNDTVDVQGNDGVLLAGQVRRAANQKFEGYIGDATTQPRQVETYRRQFLAFFRKNHFFEVIYIFQDGTAIKRQKGFIAAAPEVKEIRQIHPEYSVSLNFEDVNYYAYSENAAGEEIYGNSASIPLSSVDSGGEQWDENGQVWDELGSIWEEGGGAGIEAVEVDSIDVVYPVLKIQGPANNPVLENITTNTRMQFQGNITASQTLLVDTRQQVATLNGTSVLTALSGNWLTFKPGQNRVVFSAENADAKPALIEWAEVVG